jgi:hypothetical protein
MRRRLLRVVPLATLLLGVTAACSRADSDAPASVGDSNFTEGGGSVAIAFHGDGVVKHDAQIRTGAPVVVTYDVKRLTTCGTLTDQANGTNLDLFFMTKSGHTHVALGKDWADQQKTIARATLGPFDANEAGELQLWIHATNGNGCDAWDSAEGINYHFQLADKPADPNAATAAMVPPVATISGTLPDKGEQVYEFTAKQNRKVDFRLHDGVGVAVAQAFDARLTVIDLATNQTVFDVTTFNGSIDDALFTPPHDGTYRASIKASARGGDYSFGIITDVPCHHDQDCPVALKCQELVAGWGWAAEGGPKCLDQSTLTP